MPDPETMRWEGDRLMLGDDELARIEDDPRSSHVRLVMTCFAGSSAMIRRHGEHGLGVVKARSEAEKRIKQGRAALLSRAREDYELAQRIAAAEVPKEHEK